MAGIALRRGRDVRPGFSGGGGTVMTLVAAAGCYVVVIEHRGRPGAGGVAIVTGIAAGQMRHGFSRRGAVVVTAVAGAEDIEVIDFRCG